MKTLKSLVAVALALLFTACSESPQQADPDFMPQQRVAYFAPNTGPVVLVDEGHNNFLTAGDRYQPFAQVLISDGFRVKANKGKLTAAQLNHADIVVIANALDRDRSDWLPPYGQALTQHEVATLKSWILEGGALFLVADHTPFPKVIANLAEALGFQFSNGHVPSVTFKKENQSLAEHPLTYSNTKTDNNALTPLTFQAMDSTASQIHQVKSFGGSAFKAPAEAVSLLRLGDGVVSAEPARPFQISAETPRISMKGWSQGAILELGAGRVAVFSEGMMFSSQLIKNTGKKHGLRSPGAEQNEAFLLNIMHWLANSSKHE